MMVVVARALLSLLFVGLGVLHFTHTDSFVHIMPPWLSWHRELVLISGFFEIAGGIGLQIPPLRRVAGYGLIALLIAVYPANIHMAVSDLPAPDGTPISPLILWGRLPFQFLFMFLVWWVAIRREPASAGRPPARR